MARPSAIEPGPYSIFIEEEGDATTMAKGFVILFPVTDAVLLFLLFFHTLRISALSHPYHLCSNAPCIAQSRTLHTIANCLSTSKFLRLEKSQEHNAISFYTVSGSKYKTKSRAHQ